MKVQAEGSEKFNIFIIKMSNLSRKEQIFIFYYYVIALIILLITTFTNKAERYRRSKPYKKYFF